MEPNKYNNPRPPYPPPPPPEEPQNRYSGQSPYGAPYQDPRFRQPLYQGMDPRYGYGMPPQGRQWQEPLPQREQTNGMGIAGFVLSAMASLGCGVAYVSGPLWLLGLVFSIIGLNRKPRGLAIAGLIISLVGIVIGIVILLLGVALTTGEMMKFI